MLAKAKTALLGDSDGHAAGRPKYTFAQGSAEDIEDRRTRGRQRRFTDCRYLQFIAFFDRRVQLTAHRAHASTGSALVRLAPGVAGDEPRPSP